MNPDDVQNIIQSTKFQISRLKKDVNDSVKAPRTYPTDKPFSSKPYDSSIPSIRDTLENEESLHDLSTGSRGYPPRELVSSTSKRPESAYYHNPGRTGLIVDFGSSYDHHSIAEDGPPMKTAEFDSAFDHESEPEYVLNPKRNGKPRSNASQRTQMKDSEDSKNMKQIIDVLLTDSQILNQNVEDYKKAMQFMVDKHKTLQRRFEIENKKAQRVEALEQQLMQERAKNKQLNDKNCALRDKCIKLVNFLQRLSSEQQTYIKEEEEVYTQIAAENDNLRELLGISRVADPKFEEIDQYVKDKLNEADEDRYREQSKNGNALDMPEFDEHDDFRITSGVLADFRKQRQDMFSMQRTFSAYSDKNSATKTVNQFALTENVLEAASRTPSSSAHSWEQIKFVNTSMSSDASRGELSVERTGRTISSDK